MVGVAILAVLALAACGSGGPVTRASTNKPAVAGSPASAQETPPTDAAARSAGLRFSRCMRAGGVPSFPDPGSGGGGGAAGRVALNLEYMRVTAAKSPGSAATMTGDGVSVSASAFRAATRRCQKDLPHRQPSVSQIAQLESKALSFARCMRAHGVPSYHDPQVAIGPGGYAIGIRIGWGPSVDPAVERQSPAFQQAGRRCGGLLPHSTGIGSRASVPSGVARDR